MSLPAIDTFSSGSDQSLTAYSANWTNLVGSFWVYATGHLTTNALLDVVARWNADTFADDQYAEAVFTEMTGDYIGVAVRCAAAAETYYGYLSGSTNSYLFKLVSGVNTNLGTGAPFGAGDVIRLEVSGTTLTPKRNGAVADIGPVTDASIAGGYAGVCGYGGLSANHRLTSWEGGNLTTHIDLPRVDYSKHPKLALLGIK